MHQSQHNLPGGLVKGEIGLPFAAYGLQSARIMFFSLPLSINLQPCKKMFADIVSWLVAVIGHWGYPGIVVLMFLESSFFPFPSEVVVPPAGYLAASGEMSLALVVLSGIGGSLLGSLFNYYLAVMVGRPFLLRYGSYLMITPRTLDRAEVFFADHGHISTFIGRLIPGVRQYISLPAGLARMNLAVFTVFTGLGAGLWVLVLALAGYFFGRNQAFLVAHLHQAVLAALGFCVLLVVVYVPVRRRFGRR